MNSPFCGGVGRCKEGERVRDWKGGRCEDLRGALGAAEGFGGGQGCGGSEEGGRHYEVLAVLIRRDWMTRTPEFVYVRARRSEGLDEEMERS